MNPLKFLAYSKFFSAGKFIYFITHLKESLGFVKQAMVLFYCFQDPDTPKFIKALIMGALGYLIVPTDMMPDVLAGIGWLDDIAVLTFVLNRAEKYIKPVHRETAHKKIPFVADSTSK